MKDIENKDLSEEELDMLFQKQSSALHDIVKAMEEYATLPQEGQEKIREALKEKGLAYFISK